MVYARIRKGRRKNLRLVRKIVRKGKKTYSGPRPGFGNIIGKRILASHQVNRLVALTGTPSAGNMAAGAIFSFAAGGSVDQVLANPWLDASEQVRGFEQLRDLYESGRVIGAKVKVTFTVERGATVTPMVGITYNTGNSPVALTTIDQYKEHRYSRTRMLKIGDQTGSVVLSHFYSPKKMDGTKAKIDEPTPPTSFFRIFMFPQDETAAPPTVRCQIEVKYLAVWTEATNVPNSAY